MRALLLALATLAACTKPHPETGTHTLEAKIDRLAPRSVTFVVR